MPYIYAVARWEVIVVYIRHNWSCCTCMNYLIMLQLHWLIHVFINLGGTMGSVVITWINCVRFDQGNTPHSQDPSSAGNNCYWLADPKGTICKPKYIYVALREQNTRGVNSLLNLFHIRLSWEIGWRTDNVQLIYHMLWWAHSEKGHQLVILELHCVWGWSFWLVSYGEE